MVASSDHGVRRGGLPCRVRTSRYPTSSPIRSARSHRAREEGWLADSDGGVVAALTHERVRELLSDPRLRATFPAFLRNLGVDSGPFYEWMALSPLNRDGADHLRWRAAAFSHLHAAQRRPPASVSARGRASARRWLRGARPLRFRRRVRRCLSVAGLVRADRRAGRGSRPLPRLGEHHRARLQSAWWWPVASPRSTRR